MSADKYPSVFSRQMETIAFKEINVMSLKRLPALALLAIKPVPVLYREHKYGLLNFP